PGKALMERKIGSRDRRRAGAAIGLDHVAIDADLALTNEVECGHGAQRAADQALDFLGPAGLLAACGLAVGAAVGGPGQHAVFGGDPDFALVTKPGGDAIIEACGTDHLGDPKPDEAGALRMAYDA